MTLPVEPGLHSTGDDAPDARIALEINGEEMEADVAPGATLLELLRNHFKLVSVREGCGIGMCGACTVLLNGKPVSSCLQLAVLADGSRVTTVEGLSEGDTLHPVQQAFVEHSAFQCSYCTPGFVLTTVALLGETQQPTREEAEEYLAGNLCRCGSYVKILDAVEAASPRDDGPA